MCVLSLILFLLLTGLLRHNWHTISFILQRTFSYTLTYVYTPETVIKTKNLPITSQFFLMSLYTPSHFCSQAIRNLLFATKALFVFYWMCQCLMLFFFLSCWFHSEKLFWNSSTLLSISRFHSFIAGWCSIVWMHHSWCISLGTGHWGCS